MNRDAPLCAWHHPAIFATRSFHSPCACAASGDSCSARKYSRPNPSPFSVGTSILWVCASSATPSCRYPRLLRRNKLINLNNQRRQRPQPRKPRILDQQLKSIIRPANRPVCTLVANLLVIDQRLMHDEQRSVRRIKIFA